MSSNSSSQIEQEFSHRQGSVVSIPDEDDQLTTASDPSFPQPPRSPGKVSDVDDKETSDVEKESQIASMDFQAVPDIINEDNTSDDQMISQSNSIEDLTKSFGFQEQPEQIEDLPREISPTTDYETIVRSHKLYFDPNPEYIRKPQMIKPLIYKQNVMIKFLKPPSIPLGPLIIKEVRPPQPPPPPPLIIRQRPLPPLSPPPIILREKPPKLPAILTTQILTKTLPPIPPPPRSVIIEKLPPLPPKPRNIVIERWIPYEATTFKRKVIVHRAEEIIPLPTPRNIIITYDKIEAKIVREFQRHGVKPENPEAYSARYGDSLLNTKDLLAKAKELGVNEDLSLPSVIAQEMQDRSLPDKYEQNFFYENSFEQQNLDQISSNGSYKSENMVINDIDNNPYAATYENLMNNLASSSSSLINDDWNKNLVNHGDFDVDYSAQLAQYGLAAEAIPY